VTTASLGLTPPPGIRSGGSRTNPLVYVLTALAIAAFVLSLFVLDWYSEQGQSLGYRDFGRIRIPPSASFLDKLALWHYKWPGYIVVGIAVLAVLVLVVARAGSHGAGHRVAALTATVGVLLSTFAIVRVFQGEFFDPEPGAWLLPGGYGALLLAAVIGARSDD
jgi:hypothetical protein